MVRVAFSFWHQQLHCSVQRQQLFRSVHCLQSVLQYSFRLPIICNDRWLPSCSSEGSKPRRNVVTSTEKVLSSFVFCSSFSLFNWLLYSAVRAISGRRSAHYFIVSLVVTLSIYFGLPTRHWFRSNRSIKRDRHVKLTIYSISRLYTAESRNKNPFL